MATIALDYDTRNKQAQKALEYILSLGLFKLTAIDSSKVDAVSERRKKLDSELNGYLVDLSNFKFNREEANIYE